MRIEATVELLNRDVNLKTKPSRASIALGRKPLTQNDPNSPEDPKVFILVCTATNRSGLKFKIQNNIEKVFNKFTDKGNCTLRLVQPPKDIMISKCDPLKLKAFLNLISRVLNAKSEEQLSKIPLTAAALQPATLAQVTKAKEKLVILHKKDYPITKNFPSSLTMLTVNRTNLKRFDNRILNLTKLTYLNLNDNSLTKLPDLTALRALTELHLANNSFEEVPIHLFSSLGKTLGVLNLKNNKLKMIPHQISSLKNLYHLDLAGNSLKRLPTTFNQLPRLKKLDLLNNPDLKMLPGGAFLALKLENFSISNQALTNDATAVCLKNTTDQVPHLLDLCQIHLTKQGLKAKVLSLPVIPQPVKDYWNRIQTCFCSRLCPVTSNVLAVVKLNPKKISQTFVSDNLNGPFFVRCETIFCSKQCYESYQNQSF